MPTPTTPTTAQKSPTSSTTSSERSETKKTDNAVDPLADRPQPTPVFVLNEKSLTQMRVIFKQPDSFSHLHLPPMTLGHFSALWTSLLQLMNHNDVDVRHACGSIELENQFNHDKSNHHPTCCFADDILMQLGVSRQHSKQRRSISASGSIPSTSSENGGAYVDDGWQITLGQFTAATLPVRAINESFSRSVSLTERIERWLHRRRTCSET